jgi:hypothetical protein
VQYDGEFELTGAGVISSASTLHMTATNGHLLDAGAVTFEVTEDGVRAGSAVPTADPLLDVAGAPGQVQPVFQATGSDGATVIDSHGALSTLVLTTTTASRSSAFTADATASTYLCSASGGAFTVSLPSASSCAGRIYTFKKVDTTTNKVTIDPNSLQTIDGLLTYPLVERGQSVTVQSDGTNWRIIGQAGVLLESDGSRWLGPEIALPMHNYVGSPPFASDTEMLASGVDGAWPFLVTRWDASVYVGSFNNGSNFWTLTLRRLNSSISVVSLATKSTSSIAADTWTHLPITTSFSNNPIPINDIWTQLHLAKTGSPGSIYVQSLVKGRNVYS